MCSVRFSGDFVSRLQASTSKGIRLTPRFPGIHAALRILSPIVRLAIGDIQKSLNLTRTCTFYFRAGSPARTRNYDYSSSVKTCPNHRYFLLKILENFRRLIVARNSSGNAGRKGEERGEKKGEKNPERSVCRHASARRGIPASRSRACGDYEIHSTAFVRE